MQRVEGHRTISRAVLRDKFRNNRRSGMSMEAFQRKQRIGRCRGKMRNQFAALQEIDIPGTDASFRYDISFQPELAERIAALDPLCNDRLRWRDTDLTGGNIPFRLHDLRFRYMEYVFPIP